MVVVGVSGALHRAVSSLCWAQSTDSVTTRTTAAITITTTMIAITRYLGSMRGGSDCVYVCTTKR